jgi:hypothetical protein
MVVADDLWIFLHMGTTEWTNFLYTENFRVTMFHCFHGEVYGLQKEIDKRENIAHGREHESKGSFPKY